LMAAYSSLWVASGSRASWVWAKPRISSRRSAAALRSARLAREKSWLVAPTVTVAWSSRTVAKNSGVWRPR